MAATHNVKVTVKQEIAVVETIPATATAKKRVVKYKNGFTKKLGAATTPAATQYCELYITIASGVASVDLMSLPGADGVIDGTGLKVQAFSLTNLGSNIMWLEGVGATVYWLFGQLDAYSEAVPVRFYVGASVFMDAAAGTPVISASQRYIKFEGTNGDTARVSIALG